MRRTLAPLSSVLVLGCATVSQPPKVTVTQVTSNFAAYDGQVVLVRGWLDECHELSCGLFASRAEAVKRQYGDQMLSIGSTRSFDDKAVGRGPVEIVLKVKVDGECRLNQNIICTDRAHELVPISVRILGRN
jgi:hypothetical protein